MGMEYGIKPQIQWRLEVPAALQPLHCIRWVWSCWSCVSTWTLSAQIRPRASWVTEEHFGFPKGMPCTRVSVPLSLLYSQHLNLSKCDVPITEYLLLFSVGDAHSHSSHSTPVHSCFRFQKKLKGYISGLNLWLFSLPTWGASVSLCHHQAEGCCHCAHRARVRPTEVHWAFIQHKEIRTKGMNARGTSALLSQFKSASSFPHYREFLLFACWVLFSLL